MTANSLLRYFHKGKAQAYAWPGGYPVVYFATDGEALCPDCVTKNRKQIIRSTHERSVDGWGIAWVDANWEDASLFCCNCNKRIESAYAESDS